jgi:hypothetical protein
MVAHFLSKCVTCSLLGLAAVIPLLGVALLTHRFGSSSGNPSINGSSDKSTITVKVAVDTALPGAAVVVPLI